MKIIERMTTKEQVLQFLENRQWIPVKTSRWPHAASLASKRRIQTDRMRLEKLPTHKLASIVRYIQNGAIKRMDANRQFEKEGFVSYRQLILIMPRFFPDIF